MRPRDEALVGKKAVKGGILPPERVETCLQIRRRIEARGIIPPALGEIALEKGWVTRKDLSRLYDRPGKRPGPPAAAPARRTFRERAVEQSQRKARRKIALFLFLAALSGIAAAIIELI